MEPRLQSALSRRDRIWPAVVLSVAVHAAAIGVALVKGARAEIDLEQKPIVAKLVRLGEQRPKELLPRKDAAPPPPAAPEAPAVPVPVPPSAAPAAPTPAVAKAPAPKTPAAPARNAQPSPARGSALSSVLNRVREQADEDDRWGDPEGDPGGDSAEGEGDRYLALVTRALHDNYKLPSTISDAERMHLRAQVVLYVDPDGRITRFSFERRSGNDSYDAALERAIRQTRVPPPPADRREAYRSRGISVLFRV